jgi:uncharacterized protein
LTWLSTAADNPSMELLFIALGLCLAAAVHGTIGFGFGLIALALLGNLVDLKQSSMLLAFSSLPLVCWIAWSLRRHFRWKEVWILQVCSVAAIPFGVHFLEATNRQTLSVALGVVLIAAAGQSLTPGLSARRWHPVWLGVPAGLFSGLLSGAFATGGPPIVAYLSSRRLGRLETSAAIQMVFLPTMLMRIAEFARRGLLTGELVGTGLLGGIFVITGAFLGTTFLRRISEGTFRRLVMTALFLLGIRYLAAGF